MHCRTPLVPATPNVWLGGGVQLARSAVNGPLPVCGNLEIRSEMGRVVSRAEALRLCRCGQSNTKPLCDGSHSRVGFRASCRRRLVALGSRFAAWRATPPMPRKA